MLSLKCRIIFSTFVTYVQELAAFCHLHSFRHHSVWNTSAALAGVTELVKLQLQFWSCLVYPPLTLFGGVATIIYTKKVKPN